MSSRLPMTLVWTWTLVSAFALGGWLSFDWLQTPPRWFLLPFFAPAVAATLATLLLLIAVRRHTIMWSAAAIGPLLAVVVLTDTRGRTLFEAAIPALLLLAYLVFSLELVRLAAQLRGDDGEAPDAARVRMARSFALKGPVDLAVTYAVAFGVMVAPGLAVRWGDPAGRWSDSIDATSSFLAGFMLLSAVGLLALVSWMRSKGGSDEAADEERTDDAPEWGTDGAADATFDSDGAADYELFEGEDGRGAAVTGA